MLVPVYIVGFILGGFFLFAVAARIPNRRAQTILRYIAIFAGPVFFAVVLSFSGWERKRTFENEWLIGTAAGNYFGHGTAPPVNEDGLVVLRRPVSENVECFELINSADLVRYLQSLPERKEKVEYTVTYDFFVARSARINKVGDFGHDAGPNALALGYSGGEKRGAGSTSSAPCLPW